MKRILNSYKGLESIKQLGDVGGGPGATLNMIVSKYSHNNSVYFNFPYVKQDVPSYRGMHGLFIHYTIYVSFLIFFIILLLKI